jgi:xanthine dehydrogenase small subunit
LSAASAAVEFVVNGRTVRAPVTRPQTTLLDWLRESGLAGAKEGCAEGECGACAVALVVPEGTAAASGHGRRAAFRIVNSCLMFLPMAAGREIVTVEGLAAPGRLADAQQVMAAAGGSQCGYCTPGFVMSLFAEQHRHDRSGPCDPLSTAGNLCRCTGYRPIRDAAASLGPAPAGPHADRLTRPVARLGAMAIGGFTRPETLGDCLALLAAEPDATIVAGATDLGVESTVRGRRFRHIIDIDAVDELKIVDETSDAVHLGAASTLTDIGRRWTTAPPVVHEWLALFASPPIRNRATLGGSLVTASPVGDAAPLLAALDARLNIAGAMDAPGEQRSGQPAHRTLDVAAFFTGYRRTALRPGELLTCIDIPKPLPRLVRFYKIAKRRLDDISIVAAAFALDRDDNGLVRRARFAFGGVAATPLRVTNAEDVVVGRAWDEDAVARVQGVLDRTLAPLSDHRGSAEFRREVAKSLVEKFWWESRA